MAEWLQTSRTKRVHDVITRPGWMDEGLKRNPTMTQEQAFPLFLSLQRDQHDSQKRKSNTYPFSDVHRRT